MAPSRRWGQLAWDLLGLLFFFRAAISAWAQPGWGQLAWDLLGLLFFVLCCAASTAWAHTGWGQADLGPLRSGTLRSGARKPELGVAEPNGGISAPFPPLPTSAPLPSLIPLPYSFYRLARS